MQADLHPRPAAAPADQVLAHRAGEEKADAASARSRSCGPSSATRSCCCADVSTELADVAKAHGTPRRTVLLESAGYARSSPRRGSARGRRRPVLGAALVDRPARPHPDRRAAARPRAAGSQARRRRRRRAHDRAGRGRAGHQPRPDAPALGARPARAPRHRGRTVLSRRRTARRAYVDLPRGERAARPSPRSRRTPPGWRWAPRRAWSSGSLPTTRPAATLGGHRRSRTATRSSARPSSPDDARTWCSSPRDAQLLHFPAVAVRPQGRSAGGMAGIKLAAGATRGLLRRRRPGRRTRSSSRPAGRPARCPAPRPVRSR